MARNSTLLMIAPLYCTGWDLRNIILPLWPGVVLRIAAQDWRVLLDVFLQGELHLSEGNDEHCMVTMQMNP